MTKFLPPSEAEFRGEPTGWANPTDVFGGAIIFVVTVTICLLLLHFAGVI